MRGERRALRTVGSSAGSAAGAVDVLNQGSIRQPGGAVAVCERIDSIGRGDRVVVAHIGALAGVVASGSLSTRIPSRSVRVDGRG